MTKWEGPFVGGEWAHKWGQWCVAKRPRKTATKQNAAMPLDGCGLHSRPRPTAICRAGPKCLRHTEIAKRLLEAPKPHTGWWADVSSFLRKPPPGRRVLHAANILQATKIRGWERDAATFWWILPDGEGAR